MGRHVRTLKATHPENIRYEIRKVRLRVYGVTFLLAVALVESVGLTAAWFQRDVNDQSKINQMVDTQPRNDATVEIVRDTTDDEHGDYFTEAGVGDRHVQIVEPPLYSVTEILRAMFSGPTYEVGDRVTVVLDADDNGRAWNVDDRRELSRWNQLSLLLVAWAVIGFAGKLFLWRMDWTPAFRLRAVPDFLLRPHTATARVVELRPGKWWNDLTVSTSLATLVVEIDGVHHVWDIHTYGTCHIELGTEFTVWGRPELGGWVIGLTEPNTIYPRSKLD